MKNFMKQVQVLVLVGFVTLVAAQSDENPKQNITCNFRGEVQTKAGQQWYGFLANITKMEDLKLMLKIEYPESQGTLKVIVYNQEQVEALDSNMSCVDKLEHAQIITLENHGNMLICQLKNDTGTEEKTSCEVTKDYGGQNHTEIYMALSNCDENQGIQATFDITAEGVGDEESACPGGTTSSGCRMLPSIDVLASSATLLMAVILLLQV